MATNNNNGKSLESWIWDAACSIRGAKDAPKYKEFILPLIFAKRLCDVFDDEVDRIAKEVGSRAKAFKLVKHDKKLVRFFLPLEPKNPDDPVWSVIRTLSDKIGEQLTTHLQDIAKANPLLNGIINRVDFNATTHGQRDIDDDRLSNLIEAISAKPLGLADVEPDIIGRSYEYLIRKFAEGSGQSAGEFYTPTEVGFVIARIMDPEPGMDIYDPCCGSAGLLIKCELVLQEKMNLRSRKTFAPAKLYGQENEPGTWAMANMNMIIHDMEGEIQIGDTFRKPKFRQGNRLQTFDRVVANPMWNQNEFKEKDYDADELDRFPKGAGYPGNKADWGWMQHILASMNDKGSRRRGARHRRRLARLRQRQHQQRKRRSQMVRRARPDRRRHLPAGKSFLQHHRAGHHHRAQQGEAERATRKAFPSQRQPRVRQGRSEELHSRRRHHPHHRNVHRVERSGEILAHRQPRGDCEKRLQHFAQSLHPHGRSGRISANRGDCGGVGSYSKRSASNRRSAQSSISRRLCRSDGRAGLQLEFGTVTQRVESHASIRRRFIGSKFQRTGSASLPNSPLMDVPGSATNVERGRLSVRLDSFGMKTRAMPESAVNFYLRVAAIIGAKRRLYRRVAVVYSKHLHRVRLQERN